MLELMVHGSPWIVAETIDACVAAGARVARPGEFTRRAVANGKLDLVQAEAINELASAETAWQARMARAQVSGLLSSRFAELKSALTDLLAQLEAALDFAHHDIPYDREAAVAGRTECVELARALLATAAAGRRVRDGVRVVILGPPNSGKSTLFNLLVGHERAIVSPHPGTTRDLVEAELEIAGVRVILVDTAGLGETPDPIEQEGVRRARGAAAEADAIVQLWPVDGHPESPRGHDDGVPVLRARSRWDLAGRRHAEGGWLPLSCVTGDGVAELRDALAATVVEEVVDLGGAVAIGRRHREVLERVVRELEASDFDLPELAAEAVRVALDGAGELLGEVVVEDVLDRVFAGFCIGK
jgi:tRNA modification GTPase